MGYDAEFARFYNQELSDYPETVAPAIIGYFNENHPSDGNRRALDFCCGTGHLVRVLFDAGFDVTGVDASREMLRIAGETLGERQKSGRCRLVLADVTGYRHDLPVDLVTATSDSVNHMKDISGVSALFVRAYQALTFGGLFIFDLITPRGLSRWGRGVISRKPLMILRGRFDPDKRKAVRQMVSYLPDQDRFDRFEGELEYQVIEPAEVAKVLEDAGFMAVRFHPVCDFGRFLDDPGKSARVFVSCRK